MTRRFAAGVFFCLAFLLSWHVAQAQTPARATPAALVESFYKPGFNESDMPLSSRLQKAFDAALANSRKLNAPVQGLDFAWTMNAQDWEPGFIDTLRVSVLQQAANTATVAVTFRNLNRNEELHYTLLREADNWVVDDILSLRGEKWRLIEMLEAGAREK